MREIQVKTGSYNYKIIIGINSLRSILQIISDSSYDNIAVLMSSNVFNLHKKYIDDILRQIPDLHLLMIDDTEKNKSYQYAEKFFEELVDRGLSRKSLIIGIGGGVVGDFAGYIASLYMRGLPVIHVPTTLLAMVDSSIGGKVAVNISRGKNMVGAFHQPLMVVSDLSFLNTLPESEFKNGVTEILKHGLIGQSETIRILERNNLDTVKNNDIIAELVYLSARFKSSIVSKDEKESGLRSILNLGHTVGHSIESIMHYENISHGEAVALGIKISARLSCKTCRISEKILDRINIILDRYRLTERRFSFQIDDIISHMKYDKKNFRGKINFVLLEGIGKPVYNQEVDAKLLKEVLNEFVN